MQHVVAAVKQQFNFTNCKYRHGCLNDGMYFNSLSYKNTTNHLHFTIFVFSLCFFFSYLTSFQLCFFSKRNIKIFLAIFAKRICWYLSKYVRIVSENFFIWTKIYCLCVTLIYLDFVFLFQVNISIEIFLRGVSLRKFFINKKYFMIICLLKTGWLR